VCHGVPFVFLAQDLHDRCVARGASAFHDSATILHDFFLKIQHATSGAAFRAVGFMHNTPRWERMAVWLESGFQMI